MESQQNLKFLTILVVGGGAGNIMNSILEDPKSSISPEDCVFFGTDKQSIDKSLSGNVVQIGSGYGAGADNIRGKEMAVGHYDSIEQSIKENAAHVFFFIICGGGGTGSGCGPVIADAAKKLYPDSVVIVLITRPFSCEGERRRLVCEDCINNLNVDSMLIINNDDINNYTSSLVKNLCVQESLKIINYRIYNVIGQTANLLNRSGFLNIDISDVKTIIKDAGECVILNTMLPVNPEIHSVMNKGFNSQLPPDSIIANRVLIFITSNQLSNNDLQAIVNSIKNKYTHLGTRIIIGYYPDNRWAYVSREYATLHNLHFQESHNYLHEETHVLINKKDFDRIQEDQKRKETNTTQNDCHQNTPESHQSSLSHSQMGGSNFYHSYFSQNKKSFVNSCEKNWVNIFVILSDIDRTPDLVDASIKADKQILPQKPSQEVY